MLDLNRKLAKLEEEGKKIKSSSYRSWAYGKWNGKPNGKYERY